MNERNERNDGMNEKDERDEYFIPSTLPSNPFNNYYIYSMYIIILNLNYILYM